MKRVNKFGKISMALIVVFTLVTVLAVSSTVSAQMDRGEPRDGLFDNLNLNRPIEIDGDLSIEGNVESGGDVNGEGNLEIGENVEGRVSISGNVSIGGSINPGASISLETPGTTLNVEAGMNSGSIEVSAGDGEINIGENMESGNISLTGEGSRVNINGSTESDSSIEGVPTVNVSKNVSGEIDVSNRISVGENLREEGRLISEDDVEIGETVSGEARSRNNISIGGDLSEDGSATLETPGTTLEIDRTLRGEATVTDSASVSIGEIPAEAPVEVSVDSSPLDGVNISVQNTVSNVDIEISNLEGDVDADIDEPEGAVYNYQEIEATPTEEEIEEAKINTSVEKSWLNDQGIEAADVRVNRYQEGAWEELPTEVIGENATHIHLESETPGFSTFSISTVEDSGVGGVSWMLIGGIIIAIIVVVVIVIGISRR